MAPSENNSTQVPSLHLSDNGSYYGSWRTQSACESYPHVSYATGGFDATRVLAELNHKLCLNSGLDQINNVCAVIICDCQQPDLPIIYCSQEYERMTGYTSAESIGRNPRFLRWPDGQPAKNQNTSGLVQTNMHEFDDNKTDVFKISLRSGNDAQVCLVNYHKSGRRFLNLMTATSVAVEDTHFSVGLLHEVSPDFGMNDNSTYRTIPEETENLSDAPGWLSLTSSDTHLPFTQSHIERPTGRDKVVSLLAKLGNQDIQHLDEAQSQILLDNASAMIHVLSLSARLLYASPVLETKLEYQPDEMVDEHISYFIHPDDLVELTQKLDKLQQDDLLDIVYRMRKSDGKYLWFESTGSAMVENDLGRSGYIVLTSSPLPVYPISRKDLDVESDNTVRLIWAKLSTSGFILFGSPAFRALVSGYLEVGDLDVALEDDLLGTTLQQRMCQTSWQRFQQGLEMARQGHQWTINHCLIDGQDGTAYMQSTFSPGEGPVPHRASQAYLLVRCRYLSRSSKVAPDKDPSSIRPNARGDTPVCNARCVVPEDRQPVQRNAPDPSLMHPPQVSPSRVKASRTKCTTSYCTSAQSPTGGRHSSIFLEYLSITGPSWEERLRSTISENKDLAAEIQASMRRQKATGRKRRALAQDRECINCHTKESPEWRRGSSGQKDLCNRCGLRWMKQPKQTD